MKLEVVGGVCSLCVPKRPDVAPVASGLSGWRGTVVSFGCGEQGFTPQNRFLGGHLLEPLHISGFKAFGLAQPTTDTVDFFHEADVF